MAAFDRIVQLGSVLAVFFAIFGSVITSTSCAWVKVQTDADSLLSHSFFGIWRHNERNSDSSCLLCCRSYPSSFEPDAALKTARVASILAPVLGVLFVIFGLTDTSLKKLAWIVAVLAAIFQGLTLLVQASKICDEEIGEELGEEFASRFPRAFCTTGISTWAWWCSILSMLIYALAATLGGVAAAAHSAEERASETPSADGGHYKPGSPAQEIVNNAQTPPEQPINVVNQENV